MAKTLMAKTLAEVFGIVPPVSARLSPVRRTARLLLLLREPRTLGDLQETLGICASQLRTDLRELKEEGWPIEPSRDRGRTPKLVWLAGWPGS